MGMVVSVRFVHGVRFDVTVAVAVGVAVSVAVSVVMRVVVSVVRLFLFYRVMMFIDAVEASVTHHVVICGSRYSQDRLHLDQILAFLEAFGVSDEEAAHKRLGHTRIGHDGRTGGE